MRQKNTEEAIKCFELTSNVSGRSIEFLEKIIDELIRIKDIPNAEKFLKQTKSDDLGSTKHVQLNFKVGLHVFSPEAALEMGRKIVAEGQTTPEVTRKVVQLAIETGKMTLAESLIIKGTAAHPEIRKELYLMLEQSGKTGTES